MNNNIDFKLVEVFNDSYHIKLKVADRYFYDVKKMLYEDLYDENKKSNVHAIYILPKKYPQLDQDLINIVTKEAMFIEDYLFKCRTNGFTVDEKFVKNCIEKISDFKRII